MALKDDADPGGAGPKRREEGSSWRPVHVLLMLYSKSNDQLAEEREKQKDQVGKVNKQRVKNTLEELYECHKSSFSRHGVVQIRRLKTNFLNDRKEHFGFRDGIAQPVIEGVPKKWQKKSGVNFRAGNTVNAGEFLLGYENEYGEYPASVLVKADDDRDGLLFEALSPDGRYRYGRTREFGRNGSYLVFRQLHQRVSDFWRYVDVQSKHPNGQQRPTDRVRLASKMVGRWPSGAPLVVSPRWDNAWFKDEDRFQFMDVDRLGERCPIGSHIRRANPRDSLGADPDESLRLQKRHRIIRRGRAYGHPLDERLRPDELVPKERVDDPAKLRKFGNIDDEERGLQFICFNANISRQFEFIQSRWINSPVFEGLYNGADPIMGSHRATGGTFTQPGERQVCVHHLPSFVEVRGGAYFFMPGLRAVRFLATP